MSVKRPAQTHRSPNINLRYILEECLSPQMKLRHFTTELRQTRFVNDSNYESEAVFQVTHPPEAQVQEFPVCEGYLGSRMSS